MKTQTQITRVVAALALVGLIIIAGTPKTLAATKSTASTKNSTSSTKSAPVDISNAVTQTYNADSTVQPGMIVQLKDKAPTTVVPLTTSTAAKILGVVIPNTNVPIVLTPEKVTQQQVLVATSGHYNVLVSNQNGPIRIGDYIAISALSGVAMKAGVTQQQTIGKAAGNFTGSANVISSLKLTDTMGKQTPVAIGSIAVDVSIANNPLNQKTVDFVPAFLVSLEQTVANKSVSVARIYLSTVLLLVASFIASVMIYSGVRNGMIAVGRNPLSKKSIIKSLIETVFAGLIVFMVGVFAVYLLLKL